jgi:hypothetical protein
MGTMIPIIKQTVDGFGKYASEVLCSAIAGFILNL